MGKWFDKLRDGKVVRLLKGDEKLWHPIRAVTGESVREREKRNDPLPFGLMYVAGSGAACSSIAANLRLNMGSRGNGAHRPFCER